MRYTWSTMAEHEYPILIALGDQIRAARQEKKLSQLALAILSGVSKSYLSDLENGRRNPSVLLLARIADALGVPLGDLFPKGKN